MSRKIILPALYLINMVLLGSCTSKEDSENNVSANSILSNGITTVFLCAEGPHARKTIRPTDIIHPAIIYEDSALIMGKVYKATYRSNDTLYVTNGTKIVSAFIDLYPAFEFRDFNGDGLKDIVITYEQSMTPLVQDLLMFDPASMTFIEVQDFGNFPASESIPGTPYYYSYHRSGCADMNWDSDLFLIRNYKAISIGRISGRECNDTNVKDGIYIYKISGEQETLYRKKQITVINTYTDYKWGFIKEYWSTNYAQFKN